MAWIRYKIQDYTTLLGQTGKTGQTFPQETIGENKEGRVTLVAHGFEEDPLKDEFDWVWEDIIIGTIDEISLMKDELMLRFRTYLRDLLMIEGLTKAHNETRKVENGEKF